MYIPSGVIYAKKIIIPPKNVRLNGKNITNIYSVYHTQVVDQNVDQGNDYRGRGRGGYQGLGRGGRGNFGRGHG
jgi:hypothetical protein